MATTTNYPRTNEDECGCQTLNCFDCAQDAVARTASEANAIDNMVTATTPVVCTPYLPSTLPFAHMEIVTLDGMVVTLRGLISERDAIIGRKIAYLTQLELAHADDAKRINNLTLTIRELEALIIKRDAELTEKRAAVTYESNAKLDTLARANSLQMSIFTLEDRIKGYEADMSGTVKELEDARDSNARKDDHIEELKSSLAMMTEIASAAAKDADAHLNTGAELSDMLDASGKREDHMYETLQGIKALAESNALTDAEKVALILRLA